MKYIDLKDGHTVSARHIAAISPVKSVKNTFYYNIILCNGTQFSQYFDEEKSEQKASEHRQYLINILTAQW